MRLISEEQVFSVGGTIFILIVVTGFGAAAGYAFAVRRGAAGRGVPTSRLKRWWHRLLAYVPLLGMGPFAVLFLGQFALAGEPAVRATDEPFASFSARWHFSSLRSGRQ